eukprot:CAMPEP_0172417622 /NCGR_PEP_ID=MMETSP1064-20121228/4161_1 /TAXON_ID=202472 /ORGANISM="Aulacoseira subarctica , Strain CCAP 1002/5" /LENGTH=109 /DNA_ID=CAMNT_0013156091 /DNA_START=108 /DNA_END=437 /DNA_ORIENTATION=-
MALSLYSTARHGNGARLVATLKGAAPARICGAATSTTTGIAIGRTVVAAGSAIARKGPDVLLIAIPSIAGGHRRGTGLVAVAAIAGEAVQAAALIATAAIAGGICCRHL